MEPIYSNKYEKSIEVMKDFQRYAMFGRLSFKVISAFYLLLTAYGAIVLVTAGNPRILIYELIVLAIVIAVFLAQYSYQTKIIKNQFEIAGGGKPILSEYLFFDGGIETRESTGEQLEIGYDRV